MAGDAAALVKPPAAMVEEEEEEEVEEANDRGDDSSVSLPPSAASSSSEGAGTKRPRRAEPRGSRAPTGARRGERGARGGQEEEAEEEGGGGEEVVGITYGSDGRVIFPPLPKGMFHESEDEQNEEAERQRVKQGAELRAARIYAGASALGFAPAPPTTRPELQVKSNPLTGNKAHPPLQQFSREQ